MTPGGYRLVDGPPDVDAYLALRARSGLSPKTPRRVHPPGRRLYARHGFAETAPGSIGMALRLG